MRRCGEVLSMANLERFEVANAWWKLRDGIASEFEFLQGLVIHKDRSEL